MSFSFNLASGVVAPSELVGSRFTMGFVKRKTSSYPGYEIMGVFYEIMMYACTCLMQNSGGTMLSFLITVHYDLYIMEAHFYVGYLLLPLIYKMS